MQPVFLSGSANRVAQAFLQAYQVSAFRGFSGQAVLTDERGEGGISGEGGSFPASDSSSFLVDEERNCGRVRNSEREREKSERRATDERCVLHGPTMSPGSAGLWPAFVVCGISIA